MMELREKIAGLVGTAISETVGATLNGRLAPSGGAFADRILAIPEIAEALRCRDAVLAPQMPDLPMERVGELIKGIKPSAP